MITSKKIVLLGHFGVGKTSIIRKFVTNEFSSDYKVTIGVHILKKEVNITEDEQVSLLIWDLEGTDNIDLINKAYLMGTNAFIYVFDISRPVTYSNLIENITKLKKMFSNTKIKVVGNKIDLLDGELNHDNHPELIDGEIIYSSAKTGTNIEELFDELTQELIC